MIQWFLKSGSEKEREKENKLSQSELRVIGFLFDLDVLLLILHSVLLQFCLCPVRDGDVGHSAATTTCGGNPDDAAKPLSTMDCLVAGDGLFLLPMLRRSKWVCCCLP